MPLLSSTISVHDPDTPCRMCLTSPQHCDVVLTSLWGLFSSLCGANLSRSLEKCSSLSASCAFSTCTRSMAQYSCDGWPLHCIGHVVHYVSVGYPNPKSHTPQKSRVYPTDGTATASSAPSEYPVAAVKPGLQTTGLPALPSQSVRSASLSRSCCGQPCDNTQQAHQTGMALSQHGPDCNCNWVGQDCIC